MVCFDIGYVEDVCQFYYQCGVGVVVVGGFVLVDVVYVGGDDVYFFGMGFVDFGVLDVFVL